MLVMVKKYGVEIEVDVFYFVDIIYNEMVEIYGKEEVEMGGYQVYVIVILDM